MNTSVISESRVKHKRSCDCAACHDLRDGSECDQCGGPLVVVENSRVYSPTCLHCGASATVLKSEVGYE